MALRILLDLDATLVSRTAVSRAVLDGRGHARLSPGRVHPPLLWVCDEAQQQ